MLAHFGRLVGQCKAHHISLLHTGMQREHSSGAVCTRQCVHIDSITPIYGHLLVGKEEEEAECCVELRGAYRSVLGVAWTALTRADLAVYIQALQRRAHAPRIQYCKRLNVVIGCLQRRWCGLRSIQTKHPLNLAAFIDAAFEAQPEEPTGFALRGLAAILCEDRKNDVKPNRITSNANLIDSTVRRVVRSTFGAELDGLVDSIERMLLLQCALHQTYCGTAQSPEEMVALLEHGMMYPPLDICVDARAVYDAISAAYACEPAVSSLKFHLISVGDRMTHGIIRQLCWVDTRDMLADGLTKGGVDRTLLTRVCDE